MPDEEALEEGVLSPVETEVQDPLLKSILADNAAQAPTELEKPLEIPAPADEVDCVVIGTGAGGAPLLARLAMAGLKVVALEAGPWHDPKKDFATDEKAQEFLFWNDERLSAGHDPIAFGKNNSGTGVGGSTLHYTAYTPRPQPADLHLRRDFGVGQDWPFGYEELEPYFEELEQFLGISGPTPYPWGPARKKGYPLAPLPLNGAAQLMQRGCEKLGIRTSPAANAALSARYYQEGVGWREACTNRGFCQAGCSTGAKASMDVTFLPLAAKHGADIRPGSYVTEIERDQTGRITGVVYTQNGQQVRQRCRHLFLCAGAIETPRLLLLNELALNSGHVGRNFMAHPGVQVFGTFEEAVRPYKGIPGALISEDTHRPKDADFAGGYLLQSIGVMPVTFAGEVARGRGLWGQPLRDYMRQYNHVAGINILGDCLPHEANFLELAEEKDARGLPKPRIHFTSQPNELRMSAHAEALMRRIWEAAGATDIWSFPRNAHIIGTARMGLSGDDAVVDANGRAFDVPNLYICDNSVFPSALSVNPALTIMALSLRTADKFLGQHATTTHP
ncbi:Choline dehydrogenase [Hymenobacter daecheongensis DSM 21074]|uniref:Choline dehydrogenase n=1 Tax=Hymenobacter daecheongensis DSM 21074 TaxID=1121955 RepID=A0A1M6AMF6_9BACT|nr:GMC family oxidoreductase [Hymenobacter daecheongensis]SHI37587.1 Choline dehydrogenase [Hymenobacter daecheongensis DSM 21074]